MAVYLPSEDSFDPGAWRVVGHLLGDMKMVASTPERTPSCSAPPAKTGFAKFPALLCHMLSLPTVIRGLFSSQGFIPNGMLRGFRWERQVRAVGVGRGVSLSRSVALPGLFLS